MTETSGIVLEARRLEIGYISSVAEVNWEPKEGQFWVIRGPNGCGKSTLLKTLVGLLSPLSGTLKWSRPLAAGYIPQSVEIHPSVNLRVLDFVMMGRRALVESGQRRLRDDTDNKVTLSAVQQRLGIGDILHRNFWDLSGGQQRRAILARTLMVEPECLLVDEPSTGLDRPSAIRFYEELNRLHKEDGKTVFIVSHEDHYLSEIEQTRILDFRDGRFVVSEDN